MRFRISKIKNGLAITTSPFFYYFSFFFSISLWTDPAGCQSQENARSARNRFAKRQSDLINARYQEQRIFGVFAYHLSFAPGTAQIIL
jgi:hypothetical protein